ncbi:T9SS type A sorting domain-containing protein [candidate division WOR-3 bacterium]|nr:T9SS type A sorting domain-containing protein [candidate division WOR-3 bacterium]
MKRIGIFLIGSIVCLCCFTASNSFGLKYVGEFYEVEVTIQSTSEIEELKEEGVRYLPAEKQVKYPEKYVVCVPVEEYVYLQQKGYSMKIIKSEQSTEYIETPFSKEKTLPEEEKWYYHVWTKQRNGIDYDSEDGDVQPSSDHGGYTNGVVLSYGWPSGWAEWVFKPPTVYGNRYVTEMVISFYGKDTGYNGPDFKVWNFYTNAWYIWATGATEKEYAEGFYPDETPPAYKFVDWSLPHRIRFRLHATNADCSWIKWVKCVFKYNGSSPYLDYPSVTPDSGYPGTNFTWKIHYYDPEGENPTIKEVYIKDPDGDVHDYDMSGSGSNAWYTYQRSLYEIGTYQYRFYFEEYYDGGTGTAWYPGPTVTQPTVTYTFKTSPNTNPPKVKIDGTWYDTDKSFQWEVGSTHQISAPDQAPYYYDHWSDGGAQTHNITVGSSDKTFTAYFNKIVTYTFKTSPNTNPPKVKIDGTWYSTDKSFNWEVGGTHEISAPYQYEAPYHYYFDHWSDGGAETHTITVGSSDRTITAYFNKVGVEELFVPVPKVFYLSQNSPNPVRSVTTIPFGTPKEARARLKIYDLTGKKVRTLMAGTVAAGHHTVTWNGRDDSGQKVAPGIYFYRLETEQFKDTKKLILLR